LAQGCDWGGKRDRKGKQVSGANASCTVYRERWNFVIGDFEFGVHARQPGRNPFDANGFGMSDNFI